MFNESNIKEFKFNQTKSTNKADKSFNTKSPEKHMFFI